jgi:ribosomal protein L18
MINYILGPTGRKLLQESVKLSGRTHSIIDGLNRCKHAIMRGDKTIYAQIIDLKNLTPLSSEQAKRLDKVAEEARKKKDYFTGSTFGNKEKRYSVEKAIELAKKTPVIEIPIEGFVEQQVRDWWEGDEQRAKKTILSKNYPIIIAKN